MDREVRVDVPVWEMIFKKRWTIDDLEQIDPELHEALAEQQQMLAEHQAAMLRGWAAALKRMEDHEVEQAKAIFPGATVIGVRRKNSTPNVD
jgi:hypothetical protein